MACHGCMLRCRVFSDMQVAIVCNTLPEDIMHGSKTSMCVIFKAVHDVKTSKCNNKGTNLAMPNSCHVV